jgi:hypothetical protein
MTIVEIVDRVGLSVAGRFRSLRAYPVFSAPALQELVRERRGPHPAEASPEPHLRAAVDWLRRAQDATPDDGIARGFSLVFDPFLQWKGWQPSYPETTGYIVPTLYAAADRLGDPDLARRAERAARWEIAIQLASGAVRGGVVGQPESPAVFNTGQVMFGWLAAFQRTGDGAFADATRRAGRFLAAALGPAGLWEQGRSRFASGGAELYNARTAWALAEAGKLLEEPTFVTAAARALHAVRTRQHANGWFPDCCLGDPRKPLLHTIAYTVRGLLEGGRVLEDPRLTDAAILAAEPLAESVSGKGWMPGRYDSEWRAAAAWSCLTGQAQMAVNWLRLTDVTGDTRWAERVPAVIGYLKSTQNRTTRNLGLHGGIKGSAPVSGEYGRYQVLSWATKFFADALMRHERWQADRPVDEAGSHLA